jgi:hypothetical protein
MGTKEIGTVVCTSEGPNSNEFSFVVTRSTEGDVPVRRGQIVGLKGEEGEVVGSITEILKTNRYFERAESVREFERSASIRSIFPIDKWEYVIANAKLIGTRNNMSGGFARVDYPPSPGEKVYLADDELICDILGFEHGDGLDLGTLYQHNTKVNLNLSKFLQKHVALLGISGGGKSYLASVILEELLSRQKEEGRLAIIVIDVHGEYTSFSENSRKPEVEDFSDRVRVMKGSYFEIAARHLTSSFFMDLAPQMSLVQARELGRVIEEMRQKMKESKQPFDLSDMIHAVEVNDGMNQRVKEALLGWLYDIESMKIVGRDENPKLEDALVPGKAMIIDLSDIVNLRRKQIIVTYLATRLFSLRRREEVPPFVMILEEAHQFCPEGSRALAPSRGIIETIAREGRKFFASLVLISQRPVRLSTTVLSQCNTQVIMRVTNPYDLQHIGESSEAIDRSALDTISSLRPGEALIVGSAVNFPVFIHVRKRKSDEPRLSRSLEDVARSFDS